jgi:DNA-binding PucR family transcriptional regulator
MTIEKDPFDETFDSLETLVDTISEVLHCPVTLEDANHRLLAYSSHDPQTDQARIATIIGRRVPEKVIHSLWREGVIQRLSNCDEPIRIRAIHEVGLGNRVAIAIRKNNDVLGYIWVLEEENPLNEQAMHQLKKAAQAAKTKLLQLQVQKRKQEEGYQEFFWKLLTGHVQSIAAIKEQAEKLLLALPPCYRVLVFQFQEEISKHLYNQIHYLITTTQRVRVICHVVDRNQLILLASPYPQSQRNEQETFTAFIRDFFSQMKERYQVTSISAGAGSLYYEDYTKVEKSYQEALTVLQIKRQFPNSTKDTFHFEELGFYRYLPAMLEQKRAQRIVNPHLQKLRDYDREHHAHLLKTLEVYLSCDCNVKEAADLLHVHTNTLNYRLSRISEIAGINLKNMDHKVSLYLDLKMEQGE